MSWFLSSALLLTLFSCFVITSCNATSMSSLDDDTYVNQSGIHLSDLSNIRIKRSPGMMRNSYYRYQNGPQALRLATFFLKNRKWVSDSDIQYAEGVIRRFKAIVKQAREEEERRRKEEMKVKTTVKPYTLGPKDMQHVLRSA